MDNISKLKVIISVQGRFHAYNLAGELYRMGHLNRLMTSQPAFRPMRWGVPRQKIRTTIRYDLMTRIWRRLGGKKYIPGLFPERRCHYLPESKLNAFCQVL